MTPPSNEAVCRYDDALAILHGLREQGHIAYFAGGCVRDLLLGLEPKDYDIATDATPTRVQEIFRNTQAVGAAFGVILVRQGKSVVEVATFRTYVSYADGRRPDGVVFSTPEQDARRRDFTINGLFLDPQKNKDEGGRMKDENKSTFPNPQSTIDSSFILHPSYFGSVLDFVGGLQDLNDHILRAIDEPQHRFEEDHLRILRAIRFASRFDLTIEPATAGAIMNNAPRLIRISPERIAEELRMMLTPATRDHAWELLWQFDLAPVILRDMPVKIARRPVETESIFLHLPADDNIPFGLALTSLVLDYQSAADQSLSISMERSAAQQAVRACRKDLKISNDEAEMMRDCLNLAWLFSATEPGVAAMKRLLAGANSQPIRQILHAIAQVSSALRPRIDWLEQQFTEFLKGNVAPEPLITGDDLRAADLMPGPMFKQVLNQVYDAQLEQRVGDKQQAMALAMKIAQPMRDSR